MTTTSATINYAYSKDGTYQVAVIYYSDDNLAGNMVVMTITIGPRTTYYYLSKIPRFAGKDHLGSVRMTINSKGTVVSYDNYYPFGEIMPGMSSDTAIADAKYKYIGVEQDVETGLYAMGARYYDPWSARFFGVDTLASDSTLAQWSPYQYSFDNPVRYKDPTGKWPDWTLVSVEVVTWIQNEFSAAQNMAVSNMQPTGEYSTPNSPDVQAQSEGAGPIAMATTPASMAKLQFHVMNNFVWGEGLAYAGGAAGALSMTFGGEVAELAEPELFVTLAKSALTLKADYTQGEGYTNGAVPLTLSIGSYASDVPLGLGYGGAEAGMAIYMHFVPPPAPLRLGNQ